MNWAMARVRAGKTFTPGQERWLGLIRNHLVESLAVDREDFRLTRVGATWGRVNRDFEGRLEAIIAQINEAMVLRVPVLKVVQGGPQFAAALSFCVRIEILLDRGKQVRLSYSDFLIY